eukprot:c26527_g1_i1 orf=274-1275(-)
MFTRSDRKRDAGEGGALAGQVRVLVVGEAGVGKSSLVHLIVHGDSIAKPRGTVGCTVDVKHIAYGDFGNTSSNPISTQERDFFVELWDVSGHERYKDCRSLFYSQINGVIFVHDLSQRKTKINLQKWASDVATCGTFSAPLTSGNVSGLPVPFLVIGNKADIAPKNGGSSGNLVDAARHWVEKQGFLSVSDELPVVATFPGTGGLVAAAKEGRLDVEAVNKFFISLIRRRYFGEEMTSMPQQQWNDSVRSVAPYHSRSSSLSDGEAMASDIRLNGTNVRYAAPIPAQLTLLPSPTPYPQQPLEVTDVIVAPRIGSSAASSATSLSIRRYDINV